MEWRAVALLFVVAAALALADAQKKCKDIAGAECVADGNCPKTLETDDKCGGQRVCCRKGKKVLKKGNGGKPVVPEGKQGNGGKPVVPEGKQGNANCERRRRCERNNGTCVERSCTAAETLLAGGCRGGDCNCCVRGCIPRSRCTRRQGTCVKRECNADEKLIKNACKGKDTDCNCCASQSCKTFKKCSRLNGSCVPRGECDEPSEFQGGCSKGCVCCGTDCPARPRCDRKGGVCGKGECGAGRREIAGGCKNKVCTCCVSGCRTPNRCKNWGGTCTQPGECEFDDVDGKGCKKKEGCVCCTDGCRPKRKCERQGGTCIEGKCGSNTREIKQGCLKSTCSCCAPGVTCKESAKCGNRGGTCVKADECDDQGAKRRGCGKGCVCCNEDSGTVTCKESAKCGNRGGTCVKADECDDQGAKRRGCGKGCVCCNEDAGCAPDSKCPGECKESCSSNEFVVQEACSGDCKCCVPFPTSCRASPNTCSGACVDSRQCPAADRIPNASCDDVGCTCCLNCTVQSNCTAQRGACRQNCLSGESELANGCVGFNCKCCVPANETCPTDPNTCKGKCIDERLCGTSDRIANSSCVGEFCTCCTDCTAMANCTAEKGVCRQTCLPGESVVDKGCTGFNCKCCRPANVMCNATSTCPGMCKDSRLCAQADRIANASCTAYYIIIIIPYCTCCTNCTAMANCTAERGVCRQTCLPGESVVDKGCTGFNCKCCRPANEVCSATSTCPGMCKDSRLCAQADRIANASCTGEFCTCCIDCKMESNCTAQRGVCKQTCAANETEIDKGCSGFGCKCCSPPNATCPPTPTCQGQCVDSRHCASANVIAGSVCSGENCACCLDCTREQNCIAQRGACKQTCAPDERVLNNGCSGSGCTCCIPPPATCSATPTCPGQCVDSRQCEIVIPGSACGENCVCCLECTPQANCNAQNGSCKLTCAPGERVINNGCAGSGCTCCAPPPATCSTTPTCQGQCVKSGQCEIVIPGSACDGDNCVCCQDCTREQSCIAQSGACKQTCAPGERVIDNGCSGFGCTCCAPPPEPCQATPTCQGRCEDSSQCDAADVIAGSECSGGNCVCCLDCDKQDNCTAQRGVCKQTCAANETEIDNGCSGFGCKCCSPPNATCPPTPTCQGQCVDSRHCNASDLISGSSCNGGDCVCCRECTVKDICTVRGGSCKRTCEADEMTVPDGCTGTDCLCCMPRANACTANQTTCQGTCLDALDCDQEIPGGTCNGTFCQCCRDCKPIGDCQTLGGQCSHIASGQCPTGLVKIPNGCSGFECTCCVGTSGLISCPVSATCPGRCRDARVCPVVMTNTSCSTTGCACCLDCNDNSCAANNGVCRERNTCLSNETVLTGNHCSGNRCVCCKKN